MEKLKLTEEILKDLTLNKKMGVDQIVRETNNGKSTVRYLLEKYNLPTTTRPYIVNKIAGKLSKESVLEDFENGLSVTEISGKIGCSLTYLINFCKKNEIDYKSYKKKTTEEKLLRLSQKENDINGRDSFQAQRLAVAVQHSMKILFTQEQIDTIKKLRIDINKERTNKVTNRELVQLIMESALKPHMKKES